MEKLKFKTGDWCFFEFKLHQIKKMEGSNISEVSSGTIRTSGSDLSDRCYPLEMNIKIISESVSFWSKRFHQERIGLNHPDLHRELVRRWVELCDNKDNDDHLKELYEKLSQFGNSVLQKVNDLNFEEVEGIKLLRR